MMGKVYVCKNSDLNSSGCFGDTGRYVGVVFAGIRLTSEYIG